MMEELAELPKKAPDLMVYLKASFETVLHRIGLRGRDFEQDASLNQYYRTLWAGYDEWVMTIYNASDVLIIDMDENDVVGNPEDAPKVVAEVVKKLGERKIRLSCSLSTYKSRENRGMSSLCSPRLFY